MSVVSNSPVVGVGSAAPCHGGDGGASAAWGASASFGTPSCIGCRTSTLAYRPAGVRTAERLLVPGDALLQVGDQGGVVEAVGEVDEIHMPVLRLAPAARNCCSVGMGGSSSLT